MAAGAAREVGRDHQRLARPCESEQAGEPLPVVVSSCPTPGPAAEGIRIVGPDFSNRIEVSTGPISLDHLRVVDDLLTNCWSGRTALINWGPDGPLVDLGFMNSWTTL